MTENPDLSLSGYYNPSPTGIDAIQALLMSNQFFRFVDTRWPALFLLKNILFKNFAARGILIIAFFVLEHKFSVLLAQEIKFNKFSIKDGLSQNTINCILQDRKGFMCFLIRTDK